MLSLACTARAASFEKSCRFSRMEDAVKGIAASSDLVKAIALMKKIPPLEGRRVLYFPYVGKSRTS